MIKQNRKLLLTAKYKLINFGKKKKKKKKKIFLITEKKLCGPLSMGQSDKGGKKLFYFWPKHHEHDIKMKLKI